MPPFDSAKIRAVLLDIEGTTTPIDFVVGTLFPYAAANVDAFLDRQKDDIELKQILDHLQHQHRLDAAGNSGPPPWEQTASQVDSQAAANYVRWLISRDSKITPLKTLQGKIWEEGYRRGELKGQVYPDVPAALARWRNQGKRVAIFSSGSVLAQQLLFKNSNAGDLSAYIEAYFDTSTGPKREPSSYRKIAAMMRVPEGHMLFVSDVIAELDAARAAGMTTLQSIRPGIPSSPENQHPIARDFDALLA